MLRYRWLYRIVAIFLPTLLILRLSEISTSKPDQPLAGWQIIGQIGGPTNAVAVQGEYAYAGVDLRLVVLDISNPITPTEVGSTTPFPYFVEDVAVSGTRVYIAAGGAGLRMVDISNPEDPTELGAWDSSIMAERSFHFIAAEVLYN